MTEQDNSIVLPYIFDLELSGRCNTHCSFCPRDEMKRGEDFMSSENFALFMERMREYAPLLMNRRARLVAERAQVNLEAREQSPLRVIMCGMGESLLRIGQGSAEMRISFALLELFVRLEAVGRTDGQKFHLPMNQRQIGQCTGLSNVHVCRTLRRFERNGVITSADHIDIEIVDIGALCDLADIDLDALRAEIVPTLPD